MVTEIAFRMSQRRILVQVILSLLAVSGVTLNAQQILSPNQVKGKKVLLVAGQPGEGESNDDPLVKKAPRR